MMKLFLTVQLQPDDLLLSECLKSIKENYDLFDFIFISMISEPANGTEVLFAELAELANVRVRILPTPLDYGEHCRAIDHWIADFIQEGHIFRLDGNAILQRKGIEELKTLKLLNSDAAIGPFYIVSPQTALREMIVREFRPQEGYPVSAGFWRWLQGQLPYSAVPSGIVIPAYILHKKNNYCYKLSTPFRFAECQLSSSGIKCIFQPFSPVVKAIPLWETPSYTGNIEQNKFAELLLLWITFAHEHDFWTRLFITREILYVLVKNKKQDLKSSVKILFKLFRIPLVQRQGISASYYFLIILCKKIKNIFCQLIHAGEQK